MQQVAATSTIVNDIGLFDADQIPAFRAFLVSKGVLVRDSGSGQFFHAREPDGKRWWAIERGRAGAPVTPEVLRPLVVEFCAQPAEHAPAAPGQPALSRELKQVLSIASEPARAAIAALAPALPDQAYLVQAAPEKQLTQVSSFQGGSAIKAAAPLTRYLSDLRDDLALHAPLHKDPEESVQAFAIRRWEYADVMLATR